MVAEVTRTVADAWLRAAAPAVTVAAAVAAIPPTRLAIVVLLPTAAAAPVVASSSSDSSESSSHRKKSRSSRKGSSFRHKRKSTSGKKQSNVFDTLRAKIENGGKTIPFWFGCNDDLQLALMARAKRDGASFILRTSLVKRVSKGVFGDRESPRNLKIRSSCCAALKSRIQMS